MFRDRLFYTVFFCLFLSIWPAIGAGTPDTPTAATAALSGPALECPVAPLPPIADPDAAAFETSAAPDTANLQPAMARALEKFEHLILSIGGKFELKSAYRPPAYQAHLQQVWYKWMELRNNRDARCQALRAEVGDEFSRHDLLERQKPVTSSDHTRGLAFDATVVMPLVTRLKRRLSLDRLATLAGIMRPDIRRDPVHFKLGTVAAARGGRVGRARRGAIVAEARAARRGRRA